MTYETVAYDASPDHHDLGAGGDVTGRRGLELCCHGWSLLVDN
ncbi:hypothetical protein BH23ACT9_BH23ACT9_16700 [soil metagenome]